jgi:hypothetical protein
LSRCCCLFVSAGNVLRRYRGGVFRDKGIERREEAA